MGKKTTKTEEKQHAVTQPNVPGWIGGPYKDYMSRIQQFAAMDPSQFVPGASNLQQGAFGLTQGLFDRLSGRFNMPQFNARPPMPQEHPMQTQNAGNNVSAVVPTPFQPNPIDYQSYANDPRVAAAGQLLYGPDWMK